MILKQIKDNWKRIVVHIPVGAIVPLFDAWQTAIIFGAGFIAYEINEDVRHLHDKAYIDLQGFLFGIVGMQIALWL